MAFLVYMLLTMAVLKSCRSESSALEKFLSTGFDKGTSENTEVKENAAGANKNELIMFMKRAGLFGTDNKNTPIQYNQHRATNAQQSLNPQQAAVYYLPQMTNYVTPDRQQQIPQSQQQQSLSLSSSVLPLSTASQVENTAVSEQNQDSASKTIAKNDRQGLYVRDDGYDDAYSSNHDGYEGYSQGGGHYSPVAVHKPVYHPPSVAIKIDPFGLLKLLLQGIPKPLLNLNGKIFLGVELGKNVGLYKGHYPPPKHHAGGAVLTLG